MGITFINQSTVLHDDQVEEFAVAINEAMHEHVAPAWKRSPISVSAATRRRHPSWYPFYFVDKIPEAPGALAYHDVDTNGPYGKIGVQTTLDAGEDVCSAGSHEAFELFGDVFCADWAYSNRLNKLVARELCDPCQSDSFKINGQTISDFVLPAYFEEEHDGPYTYMDTVSDSFGIARGGYQIQMTPGGVKNVFGDDFPDRLMAGKDASHGRTFWRKVTGALWLAQ